ncbi:MAG TPA: SLC13 family permease [Casimicrobiaceae bacterium]
MTAELGRSPATPFAWLPPSLWALRRDAVFVGLVVVLALVSVAAPAEIPSYPKRIDWPTIAALGGLLLLTRGIEASGALQWAGRRLVEHVRTERMAALGLVIAAALLAMAVTNDVALFIVVPLTLGMCRIARLPAARLVIFEGLAVNVGSALTPIGNPQNIFLWQRSGVAFGHFVTAMLPLVAVLTVFLVALTLRAFGDRRLTVHDDTPATPIDAALLAASLALYAPFLILADRHLAGWGLAAVAIAFLALRPHLVRDVDWGLLLVFVLMFVDLRTLAGLASVRHAIAGLGLESAARLYAAGIVASQVVSNVPATIALAEYSHDWRVLAWAVNVGGFGLAIGSLANLIALRMLHEPGAWRAFHAWSLPFLAGAAVAGFALLALAR